MSGKGPTFFLSTNFIFIMAALLFVSKGWQGFRVPQLYTAQLEGPGF